MPSKTEEYLALAQRTANGLTRYWESWTDYLTTASRLYKYPFADQLMIYAQRPDAAACADFDIWNNRVNRYVHRGAKASPCWTNPADSPGCTTFSMCRTPWCAAIPVTPTCGSTRNTLTCQSAVKNHLSLGKIDKVKKKAASILTLHKEYGIVIKHRINFHSSA